MKMNRKRNRQGSRDGWDKCRSRKNPKFLHELWIRRKTKNTLKCRRIVVIGEKDIQRQSKIKTKRKNGWEEPGGKFLRHKLFSVFCSFALL